MKDVYTFLFAEDFFDSFVNDFELVGPVSGVNEWTHVVAIVVAAFRVKVEGRRQDGAFMSVAAVKTEESLYFHC